MASIVHSQIKSTAETFDYNESELVIGLVYAVGTDYKPVQQCISDLLQEYGYSPRVIRISNLIENLTDHPLLNDSEINRVSSRMNAGNIACRESGRHDLWALAAIAEINKTRGDDQDHQNPLPRVAHLILSLKRPQEVITLRKIYGRGFYLIGVFATEKERLDSLIEIASVGDFRPMHVSNTNFSNYAFAIQP